MEDEAEFSAILMKPSHQDPFWSIPIFYLNPRESVLQPSFLPDSCKISEVAYKVRLIIIVTGMRDLGPTHGFFAFDQLKRSLKFDNSRKLFGSDAHNPIK